MIQSRVTMTRTGNKNGQQELGRGSGSTGNENENRNAAMGTGTVTTTNKDRTTANKRSRNAAIRNEASTVGTTVWNVDENVDFDRYATVRSKEEETKTGFRQWCIEVIEVDYPVPY